MKSATRTGALAWLARARIVATAAVVGLGLLSGAVNPSPVEASTWQIGDVFAGVESGDFYVGHASGDRDIQKYNAAGVFQQKYDVATENVGSDWIELSADQMTMFYTSEGRRIFRYNVATSTQLLDFATLPVRAEPSL